jgi:hypothetical protein
LPVEGLFLACCVRGLEVSRHFTPELGMTVALMLGVAFIVGVLLVLMRPILISR